LTSDCSVAYADDFLINTQLQLGDECCASRVTVSTVYQADLKTVETVTVTAAHSNTSMNRGVNESRFVISAPSHAFNHTLSTNLNARRANSFYGL
jgi:hypothetical protein